jgi:hypothetical protein
MRYIHCWWEALWDGEKTETNKRRRRAKLAVLEATLT